jgi:acetyl-CoA C-acetyltransferase
MTNVSIIGVGQTDVREHWDTSIRHLAWYAIEAALDDAHIHQIDALYVGNMLAGQLSNQNHLGALMADFAGLRGIEAMTVEAADASGGAALRQAVLAVESGLVETALVVGVEKMTDETGSSVLAALATALDADYEVIHGQPLSGRARCSCAATCTTYGVALADFAGFSVNAHANGAVNPRAMFRNRLKPEAFAAAPMVADAGQPVRRSPTATARRRSSSPARARRGHGRPAGAHCRSALATDTLALHDRRDMLWLRAAELSARRAYEAAGVSPDDIERFELHDSFTVMAALSLEACGFAAPGEGWQLARDMDIGRERPYSHQHLRRPEGARQSRRRHRHLPDRGSRPAAARQGGRLPDSRRARRHGPEFGRHGGDGCYAHS